MIGLMLLLIFGLCILLNVPVAISLGISSLGVLLFMDNTPPVTLFTRSLIELSDSFPLIALPLFILAGEIMLQGGLSRRMIALAKVLTYRMPAGLSIVNVLASVFFSALSGSSPATVAAIGSNMIPEMKRSGYHSHFSSALTASSGMIGVLIPPSIPFIVYAVTAGVSVGAMFLAGIIPGVMLALTFVAISIYMFKTGKATVAGTEIDKTEKSDIIKKAAESFWAIIAPVIVLGGIYGGIFTPTEASAAAVLYAIIVGFFIYREIKIKDMANILIKSAHTSAQILALVIFASAFGKIATLSGLPETVKTMLQGFNNSPWLVLLLINIILLAIGMFMETIAAIIILTPIFLPLAVAIGIDPVVFGVIMVVNLAIGFCTPPLGVNLFVASAISGESVLRISKAILPYLLGMLVILACVSGIPHLSLALIEFFY